MSSQQIATIEQLDADGQAEIEARDWLAPQGAKLDFKEIAREHQGEHFTNSKQLEIGQLVLDVFLNRNRIARVVRRYPVSIRLSYVDSQGREVEYVESLRNLRRIQ